MDKVLAGHRSAPFVLDAAAVLVQAHGPLAVDCNGPQQPLRCTLGAWDTLSLPAGCPRAYVNTGSADAEALLVVQGDGRKPPRFDAQVAAAAAQASQPARQHGVS